MKNRSFEDQITEVLNTQAESCCVTSEQSQRILSKIHDISKEEQNMRHFTKRKIMAVAAAICIMASITAIASGKIAGYRSGSNPNNPTYSQFADIHQAEGTLGFPVRSVEQFKNGADFLNGDLTDVEALDENGNKIDSYPSLSLQYDLNGKKIVLEISRPLGSEPESAADSIIPFEDRELKYSVDEYLFLPPDTNPSEEELALEADGKLNISYGSSQIERKTFYSLQWREGDGRYMLFSWDFDKPVLTEMAKEVISAK